jgi:16S rRNA (guanine527-N7)-methyltransferase
MSLNDLWNDLPDPLRRSYETYITLLTKWQKSINLVSPSTISDARDRHILDSYQLVQYIPSTVKTIYDLGSGAGFPAMVIAAARPDISVSCLESDGRKCEFLRTISREINIPVTIHMGRIESNHALPPPDMITARALASVKILIEWARPWWTQNPSLEMLLPKGESWADEVSEARGAFDFTIADYPSLTDPRARILNISDIRPVS